MAKTFSTSMCDLPSVGLGTFKIKTEADVQNTLQTALDTGYRLIDTASCYKNEQFIGECLKSVTRELNISRDEIFITSKLAPQDQGYNKARESCLKSLNDLDCSYLDLYLIHWPGKAKMKVDDSRNKELRMESWRALEDMLDDGIVKAIGVSNYTISHLKDMEDYARLMPCVNQVEFHPHLYQKDLLDFCKNKGIHLQAYSSLGTGILLEKPELNAIAGKYNKSISQILLKWALQHGVGVIPKSTNPDHIRKNFDLFEFTISNNDMLLIDAMNLNKHYCWDPTFVA